ncbi:DUF4227 family protein [Paenibacillus glycanilyticus]|uniref:DUF4227 domain-containing protein n=1 Tax=Paenibacillus glycanilyticus TaxID=126569 RepID=A0ABQ6GF17_9BACL|nr:DUF4227 family protein [Paenibacillus glycanilyticus]GLX69060.1 hypothetical protein MU1_34050 [Paenibacillus glycanilyticus]
MVLSLRKWLSRILFVVIFTLLLLIVTGSYRFLIDAIAPVHPYRTPKGDALKVFQSDPAAVEKGSLADRLRWFYWYGE